MDLEQSALADIPVDKVLLREHVKQLTSLGKPRNCINLDTLNKAAEYIYGELSKLKYRVEYQPFMIGGREYKNIVASFGEGHEKRIVVGAHYDVYDKTPGADDNASGIAGLLELARLFSLLQPVVNVQVDFVAYTLEEPPFFSTENMGSALHARFIKNNKVQVAYMLCLEMLGYFSNLPLSQRHPVAIPEEARSLTGNFIALVGRPDEAEIVNNMIQRMQAVSSLPVKGWIAERQPAMDMSDHMNYWDQGYKAIMVTDTAFLRNPNYHKTSDVIQTLSFIKMAEVVKGLYWALIHMEDDNG